MNPKVTRIIALAAVLLIAASIGWTRPVRHLRLVRSEPAADSTVTNATAIRLWFSESPEIVATTIRVHDARKKPLPVTKPKLDERDPKLVVAAFESSPPPGTYTVVWRAMSKDGHAVPGEFVFSIASPAATSSMASPSVAPAVSMLLDAPASAASTPGN
jgi:hypothetical protein